MTTTYPPGAPAWIDLGTTDVAAAQAFYGQLFGWEVMDMGPDSGGYGMLRKGGQDVGGIGPATDPSRGTSWSVYFASPDAGDSESRVAANGGTVVVPAGDVFDSGRMAVFQDRAGAFFSVWQPLKHAGMELTRAPGSLSWVELYSTDLPGVKSFYASVLGVGTRDVMDGAYTVFEVDGDSVGGAMASPDEFSRWSVYFEVADCDEAADRAIELGARELLRQDSPAGRVAVLGDPQGGAVCINAATPD
jgi:predicted enzyme related to lactoylglutathione lyase